MHQGAGERDLLAHALGKALAAFVGVGIEPEPAEQFPRSLLGADRIRERVDAEYADRSRVRFQQAGDDPQAGGLARAVGPEQRVELAGADRQVEPIDGRTVEPFGEAPDLQGDRSVLHRTSGE